MQRELRLGDILDDYCPRERRLTNHAIVAMVGQDVKQTRCATCDAEHEYKHAKVPRQRRKADAPPALYAQVLAGAPKRVSHDPGSASGDVPDAQPEPFAPPLPEPAESSEEGIAAAREAATDDVARDEAAPDDEDREETEQDTEQGPVHRPLIRATLPRIEGQAPPTRPAPEFTIRQPAGRPGRFRPRPQRGGHSFQGNRSNGNANGPRGMSRQNTGRPPHGPVVSRLGRRHDSGRKRSK